METEQGAQIRELLKLAYPKEPIEHQRLIMFGTDKNVRTHVRTVRRWISGENPPPPLALFYLRYLARVQATKTTSPNHDASVATLS
jgi:hypothetical protein